MSKNKNNKIKELVLRTHKDCTLFFSYEVYKTMNFTKRVDETLTLPEKIFIIPVAVILFPFHILADIIGLVVGIINVIIKLCQKTTRTKR